ncbi:MAG: hypothetical protein ABEK50_09690 [bacterium]
MEPYRVPHQDLFHVINVINYLQVPENFANDTLTRTMAEAHTTTAPLYYFGIAYPLSFILPPKWSLLTIGFCLTLGCAFFAGGDWSTGKDAVVAGLIVIVLLHLFLSPLEGNRRSFSSFFLLWVLWLGNDPDYRWVLLVTALSAGIYPPISITIMTYYGLDRVRRLFLDKSSLYDVTLRLMGLTGVFIAVVSPTLLRMMVRTKGEMSFFTGNISYRLNSVEGVFRTFIFADNLTAQGVWFRNVSHYNIFFSFVLLLGFQLVLLKEEFFSEIKYLLLVTAAFVVWGLAHLVHPLLYQPVKYTRMTLVLVPALMVLHNLIPFGRVLKNYFMKKPLIRILLYVLSGFILIQLFLLTTKFLDYSHVSGLTGLSPIVWKFIFGLPLFCSLVTILPSYGQGNWFQCLAAAFVFLNVLLLPYKFGPRVIKPEEETMGTPIGFQYTEFGGLYKYLRTTPRQSKLAGPPVFMNVLQAYGRRPTFTDKAKQILEEGCERTNTFWSIYYSGDKKRVKTFFERNNIDLLLVDRNLFRTQKLLASQNCTGQLSPSPLPVLDRTFENAYWRRNNRFFLIGPEMI